MAYHTYKYASKYVNPWLASTVTDNRVTVGEYTSYDSAITITFALWFSDEKIEIGKFCSLAKNITIFGGGEHHTTSTLRRK
jgi:acetyltransferase-like isoleucine patch superfamily enzyme